MQIVRNVLSEKLYLLLRFELENKYKEDVWSSSTLIWNKDIKKSIFGSTLITLVSQELSKQIAEEIKDHLPNHDDLKCQFYIWQHSSGISSHNDGNYKFGATIYLNEKWDIDDGGFFIWQDKNTKELKVLSPEKNMMVLNSDKEEHLVTPVAPNSSDLRYTVQIWGY